MADLKKLTSLYLLLLLCKSATSAETESKEELVQSETKDGKLEIIKQIKKVNDDGSYTIGYEADDGSFKIESRDVLGNVKGTYGYLDDAGQVKRVSYSTSNSSELAPKPESSVVQRIPKTNRTQLFTTKRPYYSTTQSNIIQRIGKARALSTTTERPNYSEITNMDSEISKTTAKPAHLIYATSTPRVLLQGRSNLRSTPATNTQTQKSEGHQLIRPEVVTVRPTELPLFRRLALKHAILSESSKPVTEEPEIRSNILRRQLAEEKSSNFDPQQHVFTLQQSLGADSSDVYSASVTTGPPRPLFTTTLRPRAHLSTPSTPTIISRPTVRYPSNYQRNVLQDLESNTQEYAHETTTATTTTEPTASETTPTPVPVVQIPANRATTEPLVAIRHPFQRGTILVPLSQLQGMENLREQRQYASEDDQYIRETTPKPVEIEPRPIYVRRLPPPQFRPIPVQVDQNGYIRDVAQQSQGPPTAYPLPVPVTPAPNDAENEIDQISPPVSTRDFQKLLQQLIVRQTRLERISELTNPRKYPEYYQPRYHQPAYRPTNVGPYYVQRVPQMPVQFVPEDNPQPRQRQYVEISHQREQQQQLYDNRQSYAPTRRVARLLQPGHSQRQEINDEYLPPDVREMLLLRMLQLAINPALPLEVGELAAATTHVPQYNKAPMRNVEILGEESEEEKRPVRNKRYREREQNEDSYYE